MTVLDRVLATLDDDGRARLGDALAREREAGDELPAVGRDVHSALAEVAGNRVLELLTLVLMRLSRWHVAVPPGAPDPLPAREVVRAHERIVEAVVAGDGELARRRMRRHLDGLLEWMR
jgi:DNA-binding FadR family transcriptional regulator